ncbi:4-alpha-glucanotransferase [Cellulomonas sp. PhB143]|uniref:4-alpha-glucanotransferase n=1 Tax=Cellulomonas sp. PhB143 TaxID=2485186 RepID=UPI000F4883AA|nr:4-alpha-glucanotransferase [Cellulomonas sp. PhB143]ROS77057.1 4-alpha-glucanotransferase [Cellulomonas sp. PhB143]
MSTVDPPEPVPDPLLRLAQAHGVSTEFSGFDGGVQRVSAASLVAALAALGVRADTPAQIELELEHAESEPWTRMLPGSVVLVEGDQRELGVHVDDGAAVEVWVELESSGGRRDLGQVDRWVAPREVLGRTVGRATFVVPGDLPLGWHTLRARSGAGEASATLVVTPRRLELPPALADHPSWGFMAQLYSVRSRQSWGVGDLADLADLAWLSARHGADFVLINPLHAAEPVAPMAPSPYLPTSRRFVNPLYVRVEDVRETAYLNAADRSLVEWSFDAVRDLDTDPGPIDRDAAWEAKRSALEVVHAAPRSTARQAAFDEYCAREGRGLDDFATWCAITEHLHGSTWPAPLHDPRSRAVAELRESLAGRVDFYRWLQWVADEQLSLAQRTATDAGMSVGIMHDLAVGVHPEGADAWALRSVLAEGVSVGAPPDMYNQQGQDWSQPPWHPRALARAGYAPYRDMLRTVLRHAGAIRIDHVIGLFRLWWVPRGEGPAAGTYVRYDHEAMVGILCLEAQRAGAVVIGEDLGTVEPSAREYLAERGVLGTSIVWFEKGSDGSPLAPERYRRLALTSVTTHDLPPTAGYLAGEHVDLRERLGLLERDVESERRAARNEREEMVRALAARGLVEDRPSEREIVEAMHRFVRATPSVLLGVALTDAVGERRAQNQPGTDQEYPNWKVPLADAAGTLVLLEDLFDSARLESLVDVMRED